MLTTCAPVRAQPFRCRYVPPLNLSIATDTAAAFLCGAGADAYFATAGWRAKPGDVDRGNFSTHWLPSIMGRPLGPPLGDATYDASAGLWSRAFATGTKVRFNAVTNRGAIDWSDERQHNAALEAAGTQGSAEFLDGL